MSNTQDVIEADVVEVTKKRKPRAKKETVEATTTQQQPIILQTSWYLDEMGTREQWCFASNIFTTEELDKIIETGENAELSSIMDEGRTAGKNNGVRSCQVSWINSMLPENSWIFQRLTKAVVDINSKFFGYDLKNIDSLQFTKYIGDTDDHYGKHCDMLYKSFTTRKLSFSLLLSEPTDYEGGDLLLHVAEKPDAPSKDRGTIVFFPSYALHEVTPVTSGVRYSLVGWVSGPPFK